MPVFRDVDFEHPTRQVRNGVFVVPTAGSSVSQRAGSLTPFDSWQAVLGCADQVVSRSWSEPCVTIVGGDLVQGTIRCTSVVRQPRKPGVVFDQEGNDYSMGCVDDGPAHETAGCSGCIGGGELA
jgi:hypothetical protein